MEVKTDQARKDDARALLGSKSTVVVLSICSVAILLFSMGSSGAVDGSNASSLIPDESPPSSSDVAPPGSGGNAPVLPEESPPPRSVVTPLGSSGDGGDEADQNPTSTTRPPAAAAAVAAAAAAAAAKYDPLGPIVLLMYHKTGHNLALGVARPAVLERRTSTQKPCAPKSVVGDSMNSRD